MSRVIELGSEVKDVITGFTGIATSRAIHLNGCDRYWVQPTVGKDGKTRDGSWFDVVSLEVLKARKVVLPEAEPTASPRKPGGFPSMIK